MGGNFRSGRAGGCGNPQAQIDFVLLTGSGLRGNAKPFFLRPMRPREKSRLIHFKSDNPHVRSDGNVRTKAQPPPTQFSRKTVFYFHTPRKITPQTVRLRRNGRKKTGACFAHAPVLRQAVRLEEFFIERLGRLFRIVVAAEFCELFKLCALGVG